MSTTLSTTPQRKRRRSSIPKGFHPAQFSNRGVSYGARGTGSRRACDRGITVAAAALSFAVAGRPLVVGTVAGVADVEAWRLVTAGRRVASVAERRNMGRPRRLRRRGRQGRRQLLRLGCCRRNHCGRSRSPHVRRRSRSLDVVAAERMAMSRGA